MTARTGGRGATGMGSIVPAEPTRDLRVSPGPCPALEGVLAAPAVFGAGPAMRNR